MQIDKRVIRVSGLVEIPKKLEIGQEVELRLSGEIVKTETLNNQNGTFDRKYIFKPFEGEVDESKTIGLDSPTN